MLKRHQHRISRRILELCTAAIFATPITVQANDHCNPLSLNTCGVPFPSDYWSERDPASPTGVTLSITNAIVRAAVANQLPTETGISFDSQFAGSSGFSAATAVIFEFANAPIKASLPKNGGSSVLAFDLDTNQPVPIRTQLSTYARSKQVSAPSEVLEVFPESRWSFGHRILVVVTKDLRINNESNGFDFHLKKSSSRQQDYIAQLQIALNQAGIDSDDVRTATLFTVRDQDEVVAPIRNLVSRSFENEHPIRNIKVDYKTYYSARAALITGELQTDNYRLENGTGRVDFSENAQPMPQWIPFRLTLPRAAREKGSVPVALYAHGILLQKETDTGPNGISSINAGLGIATFSIDFPNHGARIKIDGSSLISNLTTKKLSRQVGMVNQNAMDFASAHKALLGLANLDVLGQPTPTQRCWKCADGIPDLDTQRVFMQGTSLGGVLGSAYAALSPDIDAAMYQVAGVGIGSILSRSVAWDFLFANVAPRAATGAEALLFKTALQQMLDPGDSINYIEFLRHPEKGGAPRPTLLLTGEGDAVVGNQSSIAMAQILGLPLIGKERFAIPGVPTFDTFDDTGFGIMQFPPLAGSVGFLIGDVLEGLTAHGAISWPAATKAQKAWMEQFVLAP